MAWAGWTSNSNLSEHNNKKGLAALLGLSAGSLHVHLDDDTAGELYHLQRFKAVNDGRVCYMVLLHLVTAVAAFLGAMTI